MIFAASDFPARPGRRDRGCADRVPLIRAGFVEFTSLDEDFRAGFVAGSGRMRAAPWQVAGAILAAREGKTVMAEKNR